MGGCDRPDILSEHHPRVVGDDNCVVFEGVKPQIPKEGIRLHYVKVKVRIHRYPDGQSATFNGSRCLARYDAKGVFLQAKIPPAAQVRRWGPG